MKVSIHFLVLPVLLVLSVTAWATGQGTESGPSGGQQGTVQQPGSGGTGQSMNDSAGRAQRTQNISTGLNVVGAGFMFSACPTHNWQFCAMGMMALGQAAASSRAAGGSGATFDASRFTGGYTSPDGTVDPYNPSFTDPTATTAFIDYKKSGATLNPDGSVTDSHGTWKPEDFKSKEGLMSHGLSASAASATLSQLAAINSELSKRAAAAAGNEANVVSMGIDGGAGGGGGGGRGPASEDGSDFNFDNYLKKLRSPFGLNGKDKEKMLAGKSVTAGEDTIGVKMDDIFRMVHHRYQEKRGSNDFIEVGLSGAPTAAPMSGAKPAPSRK